ncbi:MAG: BON domain-containing protein [Pseudomonadales bacterium]|nr:BON domain-containing protein [Pseudomonadales bacterium]
MNIRLLTVLTLASALSVGSAWADDDKHEQKMEEKSQIEKMGPKVNDAWLKGKVEMALLLNRYLNSFKIDTDVDASKVTLSGKVESDIDRDLAEQIALGVDGVSAVENHLEIAPADVKTASGDDKDRRFLQRIEDLTLTARVKSKLLLNNNVSAGSINVATTNAIVTLDGEVKNGQERDLAARIAQNTDNVVKVENRLRVSNEQPAS